jgi:hypothetical protein
VQHAGRVQVGKGPEERCDSRDRLPCRELSSRTYQLRQRDPVDLLNNQSQRSIGQRDNGVLANQVCVLDPLAQGQLPGRQGLGPQVSHGQDPDRASKAVNHTNSGPLGNGRSNARFTGHDKARHKRLHLDGSPCRANT